MFSSLLLSLLELGVWQFSTRVNWKLKSRWFSTLNCPPKLQKRQTSRVSFKNSDKSLRNRQPYPKTSCIPPSRIRIKASESGSFIRKLHEPLIKNSDKSPRNRQSYPKPLCIPPSSIRIKAPETGSLIRKLHVPLFKNSDKRLRNRQLYPKPSCIPPSRIRIKSSETVSLIRNLHAFLLQEFG